MGYRLRVTALLLLASAVSIKADQISSDNGPPVTWQHHRSHHETSHAGQSTGPHHRRCAHTLGSWCQDFLNQEPIPTKPAPRGDKKCPRSCSNVGQCDYDFGRCDCPAGRKGRDCSELDKRPCFLMGKDRKDVNFLAEPWSASRCAGVCDDNRALCWCDQGKYKHELQSHKEDPLAPPKRRGRPLVQCHVKDDGKGHAVTWAHRGLPYEKIFGPSGWCNADEPKQVNCPCFVDGVDGPFCDHPTEHFCLNQCGGRGECVYGFCRCQQGWYGQDCTRRKKDKKSIFKFRGGDNEGDELHQKPYLQDLVVRPTAAFDNPPKPSRLRPLIYIYELPSKFYRRMIEYRNDKAACTWRKFDGNNNTLFEPSAYSVEQLFHEVLLQSDHRTFDPEEADFFYVPVYTACFIWPVHGYAERPTWTMPGAPRPAHGAVMLREAQQWLQENHPWWNRNGGKDHIFLLPHDEGACWAPHNIMNATLLVHWGRMDVNNVSQTAFWMDTFDQDFVEPSTLPGGWHALIKPHVCYDPVKDLVIPGIKNFDHFNQSHFLGAPKRSRQLLLFFKGDFREGGRDALARRYSRGLRQQVKKLAKDNDWYGNYKILIAGRQEVYHPYGKLLAQSKFALVLPGDGWSGRMQDAVVYGAIPVIIMDNTHEKFESILNFSKLAVRVKESDLPQLPQILQAIPPQRVKAMRRALATTWHRFLYISHPFLRKLLNKTIAANLQQLDVDTLMRSNQHELGGESGQLGPNAPFNVSRNLAQFTEHSHSGESGDHSQTSRSSETGQNSQCLHSGQRNESGQFAQSRELDRLGQSRESSQFNPRIGQSSKNSQFDPSFGQSSKNSQFDPSFRQSRERSQFDPSIGQSSDSSQFDPSIGQRSDSSQFDPSIGQRSDSSQFGPSIGQSSDSSQFDPSMDNAQSRERMDQKGRAMLGQQPGGSEVGESGGAGYANRTEQLREAYMRAFWRNVNMEDDAIATIMQWLHSRIPHVKNQPRDNA